jgi:hypothetical protein
MQYGHSKGKAFHFAQCLTQSPVTNHPGAHSSKLLPILHYFVPGCSREVFNFFILFFNASMK